MHMPEKAFLGAGTVGERGQVAIPTEARRDAKIEAGDKMLFFSLPGHDGFIMIKADELSHMLDEMTKKTEMFRSIIQEQK